MIQYILECIAFQLVFLVIYDFYLKRETFFQWNRCYLIGAYPLSLFLPWIKIEVKLRFLIKAALKYYQLAYNEDDDNALLYFNVSTLADQYYSDPKTKLAHYEKFIEKFGNQNSYLVKMARKRISELKEEVHFSGN